MIAGGLAGSLVVIFAVSGMIGHHGGEVPVVQADSSPVRVKPENPGGLQVANANNEIFSGGDDTTGSKLAPQPETPDPKALREPPAPVLATPPAAAQQAVIAPPPPPPVTAAQPKVTRSIPAAVDSAVRVAPPPAAPHPAALASVAAATNAAGSKPLLVQLGALTSEDAARAEWQHLAKQMPQVLGSHQPSFSRFEHDGHTIWRVRTSGFADMAQAKTFCEQVRAKGGGCSIADF
jgi:hypothetical protein